MSLDPRTFRQLMGCFATGITVVTAKGKDGKPMGITINSFNSVSLDPPLVLFCLDKKAHIYPLFKKVKLFAVNILAEDQEIISRHFADFRHHPQPPKIWDKPQQTCPILNHTLGWMLCRWKESYKGGDHDIILGEVAKLHKNTNPKEPLLYFHGRYRQLKDT